MLVVCIFFNLYFDLFFVAFDGIFCFGVLWCWVWCLVVCCFAGIALTGGLIVKNHDMKRGMDMIPFFFSAFDGFFFLFLF